MRKKERYDARKVVKILEKSDVCGNFTVGKIYNVNKTPFQKYVVDDNDNAISYREFTKKVKQRRMWLSRKEKEEAILQARNERGRYIRIKVEIVSSHERGIYETEPGKICEVIVRRGQSG